MMEIDRLIDISTWTGNWPFMRLRYGDMNILKEKLKAMNVVKAFIAPIEGILEQDPMRADMELLQKVDDDFFSPVLIIDLSFENWQECMELALKDSRVRMVKLIPNYHLYKLYDEDMGELVEMAKSKGIVISIQMGIEDVRFQNPLMKVPDVEAEDVIKTLSAFPDQTFILSNTLKSNVRQLIESLNNIYIDISCLEGQELLENIHSTYSLDRFLFSSHTPFFFPEANVYKLKYTSLDKAEIDRVAYLNAKKIFGSI